MTPNDVLNKFGSQYNFSKKTGMSHSSLGHWLKLGYVPENSQYKLERLTNGDLKTQWTTNNG